MAIDTTRNLLRGQAPRDVREQTFRELALRYGDENFDQKLSRFLSISPPFVQPLWQYHEYQREIADAFTNGYFYPALTGACCLAEAILSTLVVRLRPYFRNTPVYKMIYNKDSFQNWDLALEALQEWDVFDSSLNGSFKRLEALRNHAVHLGGKAISAQNSLDGVRLVFDLIDRLFGPRDDIVFWAPGEMYVRLGKESDPFVEEFYVPSCHYVGYKHSIEGPFPNWRVVDPHKYEDRVISDEEFRALRVAFRKEQP
ncbi:MAG TPA: hypothetical protein VI789_07250 [Dehalococcoidia bacterium]|nr:hypothetical protein [Dehalococcoidia bacterium]